MTIDAPVRTTPKQKWVLILASITSFMISLDSLVVSTALPTIHRALHASLATLDWTVNAYNLTFAVLLLSGAALGDRFGRRRIFLVGLGIFVAASAACALAGNIGTLIAARAAQGCGAALVMPLALTQLSTSFPPSQRGKVLGIFSGVTGLATLSGPLVGGAVAQGLAWQWIFWLNVPVGLAVMVASAARLDETRGPNNRLDLTGALLVMAGVLGVVWALVRANTSGWGSAEVLSTLLSGVVLSLAFIAWEVRARAPMLPMRFFRLQAFATANVSNFCLFASVYGTTFMLAQYLQNSVGYDPLGTGLRLVPWTGTLLIIAPVAGRLADRLGERLFMAGGLAIELVGLAWLVAVVTPHLAYADMVGPLVITGAGNSLAVPAAQKSVVGAVRPAEIGQASGAVSMLRILGGVFGIAIASAVFADYGSYASPQAFTAGFRPALCVVMGLAALGALIALGMPGRSPRHRQLVQTVEVAPQLEPQRGKVDG